MHTACIVIQQLLDAVFISNKNALRHESGE
jgi:hypothetical protein